MPTLRTPKTRRILWPFIGSLIAWEIAAAIYMLIRFTAEGETIDWAHGPAGIILMSVVAGLVMAIFDCLANLAINRTRFRIRSFGVIITLKVVILVLAALLVILISRVVAALIGETSWGEVLPDFWERINDRRMVAALLFVGVTAGIVAFVKQMTALVGGRVLANLVTGKYIVPKAEDRIFLFLDLRDSTRSAERLGNEKFCTLVQDCFRDLTDSAIRHHVEIHKYVGDEAILTWTVDEGLESLNCLEVFFDFQDALEQKRTFYQEAYGMFPEFKAGANIGVVTALEIGVVKREIAYLSDVLNTAARIEGKCNECGRDFLISGQLRESVAGLPRANSYEFERLGALPLRGKTAEVELFGVRRSAGP